MSLSVTWRHICYMFCCSCIWCGYRCRQQVWYVIGSTSKDTLLRRK